MLTPIQEVPLTHEELEQEGYDLCEYKSEGDDCNLCWSNPKGEEMFWYGTSCECSSEGDVYCRKCAEEQVRDNQDMYAWYARAFYCAECGHMEDHAEDGQTCPKCGCTRWCKPEPSTAA